MSSEQYSPLDTTLPFFSNQIEFKISSNLPPFILPFLLKFKGIARRVRITLPDVSPIPNTSVYFNGDLENPSKLSIGTRTYNRWIKTIRFTNMSSFEFTGLLEYDVVPVQYLPPKQRRAL